MRYGGRLLPSSGREAQENEGAGGIGRLRMPSGKAGAADTGRSEPAPLGETAGCTDRPAR